MLALSEDLLLQELMPHDEEGSGEGGAEEEDEHGGQLVAVVDVKRQVLEGHTIHGFKLQ